MAPDLGPIFIVGADRSGTTLLRLIINQHPDLAVPAETWFLIDLIDEFGLHAHLDDSEVERAIAIVAGKRRWRNFSVSTDELAAQLAERPEVTLAGFFDALMTLEIAPTGKTRWVDKTPEYVLYIKQLAEMYPLAQFVEIRRDGRDVFQSLKRQRWRGRTPLRIGSYWAACIDSATEALATLDSTRWMSIRYEDLVLDLESTTRQICEFLGVPYHQSMLAFHESAVEHVPVRSIERGFHAKLLRPPSVDDVYKWKREGTGFQGWLFEAIVTPQLCASGYDTRLGRWSRPVIRAVAYPQHVIASARTKLNKVLRRAARRSSRAT